MSAGDIKAGGAYVAVTAKDMTLSGLKGIQTRLRVWGASLRHLGESLRIVGDLAGAAFIGAAVVFAQMGDALSKMSQRTGVSVEGLSALGFAAERGGASLEDVETGLRKMGKLLFEAASGSEGAAKTLDTLGLNIADLKKMSPEKQFEAMATALADIDNPTQRAALALEVFGKTGTKLLPMLEDGAAGLQEMRKRAEALGVVMTGADAAAATQLTDSFGELWDQLKALTAAIGAALVPVLLEIGEAIKPWLKAAIDWVHSNGRLIRVLFKLADLVATVGGVIFGLGVAIGALANPVTAAIAVITVIASAFGLWTAKGDTLEERLESIWEMLVSVGTQALDAVLLGIATVIVAFQQWGETVKIAQAAVSAGMTLAWGSIGWLQGNLVVFTAWLGGTFVDVFRNTFSNILQIVANASGSIFKFWSEVWEKMKNPLHKSKFNFAEEAAKLFDGVKAPAIDLPKFLPRKLSDAELKMLEELRKMAAPLGDEAAKLAEEIKKGLLGDVAGNVAKGKKGNGFGDLEGAVQKAKIDVAGTFNSSRAAGLGATSIPEQHLNATKEGNKKLDKIIAAVAGLGPVL